MGMLDDEQIREIRAQRAVIMEQVEATMNDEGFAAKTMVMKGTAIDLLHHLLGTGCDIDTAASSVIGMVTIAVVGHVRSSALMAGVAIGKAEAEGDGS